MSKHTPGPWTAIAKRNPDPSEGTHWIQCKLGALGYWRGHKQDHDDSKWILNEADARLIAAAPEMYEALIALLADPGADYIKTTAWDKARAAIAKAEGA